VDLGRLVAERFTSVNARGKGDGKPGGPPRRKLLFRATVAVALIAPAMIALQAVAGPAAHAADAPTVTGVSPSSGVDTGGTNVTITGTGFTGATAVMFGSDAESFTVVSDTEITADASAAGDGTVDVTVTTPDGTSAITPADEFTFVPAPSVTGLSPDVGPVVGGNTVTITGTGFTGATAVSFGQTVVTNFTVNSDTSITVTAPAEPAGGVTVGVTTPIGSSQFAPGDTYVYETAPVIQSFSPATGSTLGGNRVSINGTGFLGATAVSFGSTPAASFTVLDNTLIFATAPANAPGPVSISVTTPGGTSTTVLQYTFIAPAPTVTGISPNAGPTAGGTTVTITGTGFTGASAVSFGSTPATNFTVNSDTSITATAPAGLARAVDVTVTTLGSTSAGTTADEYTYQAPACTTTITGTNDTPLTVTSGLTCLVNASQHGQITVAAGAGLSVTDSTVNGAVTATSPSEVIYCGSTEDGALSVTGATGVVNLGGTLTDNTPCGLDTIPSPVTVTGSTSLVTITGLHQKGTLTLENDTDGVTWQGSQLDGRAYVENNAAPAPTQIQVAGNTVNGSLSCTGNNPAPTDEGGNINTVSGTASGQCAAISEQ
jgi:large repetitive protein